MRIPGTKIWRAFPELDRFSDEQCQRFVERAAAEHGSSRFGAMTLTVFLLAVLVPIVIWMCSAAYPLLEKMAFANAGRETKWLIRDITTTAFAALVVMSCCLTLLLVRDRWLIRTITQKVHQAACAGCGYSLLGLVPVHGVVTCPECNKALFLDDAGLTEDDLRVG